MFAKCPRDTDKTTSAAIYGESFRGMTMPQLYPNVGSVRPCEIIRFHVSSRTSKFRIDIYRQGATLQLMTSETYEGGDLFNLGTHDTDWGWPGFDFVIPQSWPSGVYLGLCVEDGAPSS